MLTKLLARARRHGRGWVFTPQMLSDLGSRTAVATALLHAVRKGTIRHLGRGLYDYPRYHPSLGVLAPSAERVAEALAGPSAGPLLPSGAYAANLLGLSEQVPMRVIFLTSGWPKSVTIGNQEIVLKRTKHRNMMTAGRTSGLVIQALRYFGRSNVDENVIATLRKNIPASELQKLPRDVKLAPAWIAQIMKSLGTDTT